MRNDVIKLIYFNTRMGMYICPSNKANVVAFLHGYEYGSDSDFKLTDEIKSLLINKYKIKESNMGWPHQIDTFSKKKSIEWMDAYLLISSEILNSQLEPKNK